MTVHRLSHCAPVAAGGVTRGIVPGPMAGGRGPWQPGVCHQASARSHPLSRTGGTWRSAASGHERDAALGPREAPRCG